MAISTYTELKTAVANWLGGRSDLTDRIPEFITLCEAKLNRELRCTQMDTRSYTSVNTANTEPEFITLPSDFQAMRLVRLSGETGKPALEFVSPQQMDSFRYDRANVSGMPAYYTIFGTEMELFPTPDDDYTIEIIYRANIPALASNSTNWLLTAAPDLYLYGVLMEAAPYIDDDARIGTWAMGYQYAIDGLNKLAFQQTFASGPAAVRIEGPTP